MKFVAPSHTRSQVAAAGRVIAGRPGYEPSSNEDFFRAYDIAGTWRSAHAYPLQVISGILQNRAKRLDPGALVWQRLKRLPSIINKLQRFSAMQLSTMQDLGGCRAVLETIGHVNELVALYRSRPLKAATLLKIADHVAEPKADGYRSVHLVYKYTSRSEKRAIYNDLRIEIQIRSKLQHLWATAVEIIDAYTYQSLKVGGGERDWGRFFALMSCHFADLERCPLVPETPILSTDLIEELREICSNLNAINIFRGYVTGLNVVEQNIPLPLLPSNMYILILDVESEDNHRNRV